MNCWLGDQTVPLPDLNTQDSQVQAGYGEWIQNLVQEYSIDGLRIDGEHLSLKFATFQPQWFSLHSRQTREQRLLGSILLQRWRFLYG